MGEMPANSTGARSRWDRLDLILLLAVLGVAGALRSWKFSELGLDHFDVGGYAMSALALATGDLSDLYPLQRLLSPPLWFVLAGLVMKLSPASGDAAMLGLVVAIGALSCGLLYVVGRRWLGRLAGLSAATLLALSDFHIGLSRSALTDVLFTFLLIAALGLYAEAENRESFGWALLAGVATGLAWNTKYHGWLAGAIAGTALLPHLLKADWARFRRGLLRVVVAAAVATALYLPWVAWVENQDGGYAYLASYQSNYLDAANLLSNIKRHYYFQAYLSGWPSLLAVPLALVVGFAWRRRLDAVALGWLAASVLVGHAFGLTVLAGMLAVAGGLALARRRDPGVWTLLAYALVFSVLSPLYKPYARLLLPWVGAIFLLAGAGIAALINSRDTASTRGPSGRFQLAGAAALCGVAVAGLLLMTPPPRGATYRASNGLSRAAEALLPRIDTERPVVVLGEPAVVYYLRRAGIEARHIRLPDGIYHHYREGDELQAVVGRYSRHRLLSWAEGHPGALTPVATAEARGIGDMRLLDDFGPWNAADFDTGTRPEYDLDLFRLKAPPPPDQLPGLPVN